MYLHAIGFKLMNFDNIDRGGCRRSPGDEYVVVAPPTVRPAATGGPAASQPPFYTGYRQTSQGKSRMPINRIFY